MLVPVRGDKEQDGILWWGLSKPPQLPRQMALMALFPTQPRMSSRASEQTLQADSRHERNRGHRQSLFSIYTWLRQHMALIKSGLGTIKRKTPEPPGDGERQGQELAGKWPMPSL